MSMAKRKTPAIHSDFGTPERARRQGGIVVELVAGNLKGRDRETAREKYQDTKNRDRARAIELDDPLYVYRRNGTITGRQRQAGMELREIWNDTGLEPRTISRYSDMISRGSVEDLHIKSADRHREFVRVIRYLTPNVRASVIAVVCLQEKLPRHKVEHLKHGLTRLQRYFRA